MDLYGNAAQYINVHVCDLQLEAINQRSGGLQWSSDVVCVTAGCCCVLVKALSVVYVSAGTVNYGPGIYNASLRSHHKTLMFINVNACDLFLNVTHAPQLKGALMSGGEAGRGGGRRLTDGQMETSGDGEGVGKK